MPANLTLSDFNNAFFDPAQNGSVAHVQKPSDDTKTQAFEIKVESELSSFEWALIRTPLNRIVILALLAFIALLSLDLP